MTPRTLPKPSAGSQQQFRQLRLPLDDRPAKVDARHLERLVAEIIARHEPGLELPPIRVSSRMKRTLGTFTPSKNLISISARLLAFGSVEQQRLIVMHEVVHAIVHRRTKGAPAHGAEFRKVCREIGLVPTRFVEVGARGWSERTRFAFTCESCRQRGLRKRRTTFARCGCGHGQRPKLWEVVALDAIGERVAVIGTSRR